MRRVEDLVPLHAQPDQGIHVEESPIAQLLIRRPPVGQPIVLQIQHIVQRVDDRDSVRPPPRSIAPAISRLAPRTVAQQFVEHRLVAMSRQNRLALRSIPAQAGATSCRR